MSIGTVGHGWSGSIEAVRLRSDAVEVDRVARDDARSLSGPEAFGADVLKGTRFNSFGAFLSRDYRKNDYLWGSLHEAERMIDILVSTVAADR